MGIGSDSKREHEQVTEQAEHEAGDSPATSEGGAAADAAIDLTDSKPPPRRFYANLADL